MRLRDRWVFILVLLTITIFYWLELPKVPFHPDESTQIYNSSDVVEILTNPFNLAWRAGEPETDHMRYRLLDAPATRYLIGIGLRLASVPPTPVDWNWSESWDENFRSGALPTQLQLLVARFSVAVLFPFSLILIFTLGQRLGGNSVGIASVLLLALNALVLLHTRRAMAESALLFSTLLFLVALTGKDPSGWFMGLSLALALNAKQTAAGLAGAAAIGIIFSSHKSRESSKKVFVNLAVMGLVFLVITFLMNPVIWVDPSGAISASISARSTLTLLQTEMLYQSSPGLALVSIGDRLANLLTQLFFNPPTVADVVNYISNTDLSAKAYFSNPLNGIGRGLFWGTISFFLCTAGMLMMTLNAFKLEKMDERRRTSLLIFTAGFFELLTLWWIIRSPFQRYILPLVPFVVLSHAYLVGKLFDQLLAWLKKKSPSFK